MDSQAYAAPVGDVVYYSHVCARDTRAARAYGRARADRHGHAVAVGQIVNELIVDESYDVIPALSVGPFVATMQGLFVTRPPTYEESGAYGQALGVLHYVDHWLVGDFSIAMRKYFPDRYDQLMAITGLPIEVLRNDTSIAGKIAPERRHTATISHSAHAAVAYLEPKEQTKWLEAIEREGYTRAELRQRIRDKRTPEANDAEERELCLNIIMGADWHTFQLQSLRAIKRIVLAEGGS